MDMRHIRGPNCPTCGSKDFRPLSKPRRWLGMDIERRECLNCFQTWNARIERKASAGAGVTSAPDDLSTRPEVQGSTR